MENTGDHALRKFGNLWKQSNAAGSDPQGTFAIY